MGDRVGGSCRHYLQSRTLRSFRELARTDRLCRTVCSGHGYGFRAARWRAGDLTLLHEWGLGGRRFGTFVTWFLLGGDLYTAYTFIAVPALVYGAGALGFFAVPYTILIYPLLYLIFPRLWSLAHKYGYVTSSDVVLGRYGNKWLALAVGVTGIVATMPYIALQLVGMQVVIGAMGVSGEGVIGDLPLIIAFVILAAFTYTSGLRAPAMIAVVKDVLIYVVVIAVTIVVPLKLGGFGAVFSAVPLAKLTLAAPAGDSYGAYSIYSTLALGSALALFLYPHSLTAILSSSSPGTIRRNAALLPAYSLVLGLLALLGFMAVALHVGTDPAFADGFKRYGNNFAVTGSDPRGLPWVVCRRGVRCDRDRRAGAVGDHVDRLCQHRQPNHLPRFPRAACDGRTGIVGREDCIAGGESRRAGFHHLRAGALCAAVPVAGRALDDPGAAVGHPRAVFASAQRLGAARRLGGGHWNGDMDGIHDVIQGGCVHALVDGYQLSWLYRAVGTGWPTSWCRFFLSLLLKPFATPAPVLAE